MPVGGGVGQEERRLPIRHTRAPAVSPPDHASTERRARLQAPIRLFVKRFRWPLGWSWASLVGRYSSRKITAPLQCSLPLVRLRRAIEVSGSCQLLRRTFFFTLGLAPPQGRDHSLLAREGRPCWACCRSRGTRAPSAGRGGGERRLGPHVQRARGAEHGAGDEHAPEHCARDHCLDTPDPPRTERYCLHFTVSRRRGLIRTFFYSLPCKYADRLKHSTQLMQPYAA